MFLKVVHIVVVFCSCLILPLSPAVSAQQAVPIASPTPQKPARREPLWKRLLQIAGITATPNTQKGPGDNDSVGDVWVVDLSLNRQLKVTQAGGYHSPIFASGDQAILALQGNVIVKIPIAGGEARKLFTLKGVTKLVGVSRDDQSKVLVLSDEENQISIEFLSLTSGKMTVVPFDEKSKDDRHTMVHLRGWERVYGDSKVYVESETKSGLAGPIEWTDVYLKQPASEPINLSRCDGTNCSQPSLSQNKRFVAYIKIKTSDP
jgi:hypothetical protein